MYIMNQRVCESWIAWFKPLHQAKPILVWLGNLRRRYFCWETVVAWMVCIVCVFAVLLWICMVNLASALCLPIHSETKKPVKSSRYIMILSVFYWNNMCLCTKGWDPDNLVQCASSLMWIFGTASSHADIFQEQPLIWFVCKCLQSSTAVPGCDLHETNRTLLYWSASHSACLFTVAVSTWKQWPPLHCHYYYYHDHYSYDEDAWDHRYIMTNWITYNHNVVKIKRYDSLNETEHTVLGVIELAVFLAFVPAKSQRKVTS